MYRVIFLLAAGYLFVLDTKAQAPIFKVLPDSPVTHRNYRALTGILGAFPPELLLLQQQLVHPHDTVFQSIHFTEGILNGNAVVVAQTGIGKVNAAIATTLMLEHFQPREIVFTGIAGGINPALLPGDLVIGTQTAYHDYGTLTPAGITRRATRNPFTMQENPVFFTCDSLLVKLALSTGQKVSFEKINGRTGTRLPKVTTGIIVTGDVFVASGEATQQLRQTLSADATEMEGAAVSQVCWQQHVPFLVIRS